MGFLAGLAGMAIMRAIVPVFTKIGEQLFPFEDSNAAKQTRMSAELNRVTQKERDEFNAKLQKEMQDRNIKSQNDIAYFNAMMNRQTTMLSAMAGRQTALLAAETSASLSLRNNLIMDAVRNFPLNISPLVLLENNNVDISFLLKSGNKDSKTEISIIDQLLSQKPLSVFISPIHIDSRVAGKEIIASQVWAGVYANVESLFVNEYSRNSERPVILYNTAWNKNAQGGLHAAEVLYYFLKDLPSLVIEPRFDGKKLKIMFSCWGLGYTARQHFRQELDIDIDWMPIIITEAYERSKKTIELFSSITEPNKMILDRLNAAKHNVKMYEELNIEEHVKSMEKMDFHNQTNSTFAIDYSKLFYIEPSDVQAISDTISSTLGLSVAAISDTHHLLASDVEPKLPSVYKKYFAEYLSEDLLKVFANMYTHTYLLLAEEMQTELDKNQKKLEGYVTNKALTSECISHINLTRILAERCKYRWNERELIDKYLQEDNFNAILEYYIKHFDNNLDLEYNNVLIKCLDSKQKQKLQLQAAINNDN